MDAQSPRFGSAAAAVLYQPVHITSPSNPLIKDIRRAVRRGEATEDGLAVAESPHLLEEAARSGIAIANTLAAESAAPAVVALARRVDPGFHTIPDKLFAELSSTENSQGLIALVRMPRYEWSEVLSASKRVVVLDGIQDPGNAGAIVRSAEAFGIDGVIFGRGSVSPLNAKTLRASAGSLFRIPTLRGGAAERVIDSLLSANLPLFAATAHDGNPLNEVDLRRSAVIIGSEAHGISPEYLAAATPVHIPVQGVESLNAAAAAAVIFYAASLRE
jgi:TrmH family RNA methyltransferase